MVNVQLLVLIERCRSDEACFGAFKVLCCIEFLVFMPVSRGFIEIAREQYSYTVFGIYRRFYRVAVVLYSKRFSKRSSASVVFVVIDGFPQLLKPMSVCVSVCLFAPARLAIGTRVTSGGHVRGAAWPQARPLAPRRHVDSGHVWRPRQGRGLAAGQAAR